MTTILSEHSRGISNSLTLSNHFIAIKMTETYSVSTLQALQLTLTKHFSQETQACIHIYRTRPLWKCTKFPDDSLHCLIKRITLLKGREKCRVHIVALILPPLCFCRGHILCKRSLGGFGKLCVGLKLIVL